MRKIEMNLDARIELEESGGCVEVDFKAQPYELADGFAKLLLEHGLELVEIDTGGDSYMYIIEPQQKDK